MAYATLTPSGRTCAKAVVPQGVVRHKQLRSSLAGAGSPFARSLYALKAFKVYISPTHPPIVEATARNSQSSVLAAPSPTAYVEFETRFAAGRGGPEHRRERIARGHGTVGKNRVLPHLVDVSGRALGDLTKLGYEGQSGINIGRLHGDDPGYCFMEDG